jgi:Mg-chelatase subunit ChlI
MIMGDRGTGKSTVRALVDLLPTMDVVAMTLLTHIHQILN